MHRRATPNAVTVVGTMNVSPVNWLHAADRRVNDCYRGIMRGIELAACLQFVSSCLDKSTNRPMHACNSFHIYIWFGPFLIRASHQDKIGDNLMDVFKRRRRRLLFVGSRAIYAKTVWTGSLHSSFSLLGIWLLFIWSNMCRRAYSEFIMNNNDPKKNGRREF